MYLQQQPQLMMKKYVLLFLLALPVLTQAQSTEEEIEPSADDFTLVPLNMGLFPPLTMNSLMGGNALNYISMDAFMGLSAAVEGVQLSGFLGMVTHYVDGMQGAGFLAIASETQGAQLGGFGAISGPVTGIQAGGFFAIASGPVTGAQAAGFINVAEVVNGIQGAGFMNLAYGETEEKSMQAAGFMNIAGDVNMQASGFINIAERAKGIQIGVINIADSANYQLGLVNLSDNGHRHVTLWVSDLFLTNVGFKSGGDKLYAHIGVGYASLLPGRTWGTHAALGWHLSPKLDLEMMVTNISDGRFFNDYPDVAPQIKLHYVLPISDRLQITGGPSLNYLASFNGERAPTPLYWLWSDRNPTRNRYQYLWIGAQAGIQVRL